MGNLSFDPELVGRTARRASGRPRERPGQKMIARRTGLDRQLADRRHVHVDRVFLRMMECCGRNRDVQARRWPRARQRTIMLPEVVLDEELR